MADIFDDKEEKKAQIEEIARTAQKAILCQSKPLGLYYFLDSGGNPNKQHIDYPCRVDSVLFTSSNRVCLLEQELKNGGKQWKLLGNGDYKLSKNNQLYIGELGVNVAAPIGVPNPPVLKKWEWSLDWILSHYTVGTSFTTLYNNVVNATTNSMYYGINGSLMCKKEFLKTSTSITDDFKLGYFEEYVLTNGTLSIINNLIPNSGRGVVTTEYSIFNFDNNIDMYTKIVNLGFIPLCRKPTNPAVQANLNPNQTYGDEDIPVYGNHRFYNVIVTSDKEQAIEYINNGTIPDDARITDSDGHDVSLVEKDDGKESNGSMKDKWIQTKENTHPVQSQLSAGTNFFYKMTTAELTAFFTWFWNDIDLTDILINTVTGLYNNMAECVLNLKYYPIKTINEDFFRLKNNSIILGRFNTDESYKKINSCAGNGILCTFDIGSHLDKYSLYSTKSRPHAFTDYAPYTDLYVYLPFYGYHKLDTNMCIERNIKITYSIDITTGALDYNIKIGGTTVDILSCNFGIDVPYTLSSMLELGSNVAKSVVDVAISAGTSIASNSQSSVIPSDDSVEREVPKSSKGGSNLVGNSFSPPALNINGKISNGIGLYHCLKPFLIIKHPRYYRASNYGKIEGYPCMKAYKLNTIKGYTECERPQIQKFTKGTPTADEIGELLNILSNGIVIK